MIRLGLIWLQELISTCHSFQSVWNLVRVLPAPEAVQGEVCRALIAQLNRAASLYRGSFLQDFTLRNTLDFDNWLGMQQGDWYQRIEHVFDRLSQLQNIRGRDRAGHRNRRALALL